ncbi:uncharacterized protein LOC131633043 [Vicia villosa]|uniref:uncharacterized protein LOC131633043 n=1 Tax=Vicia villosa TaxID=3911 RepID=UPI00273AD41E|nr:uncharacterized protein LOC131633043 [Vicia villosa]
MEVAFLFPEALLANTDTKSNAQIEMESTSSKSQSNTTNTPKSFANVVSNNVSDIPLSQFPPAYVKRDRLDITIPEEEYQLGVEACKHHLHGRVVWSKGAVLLTVVNLRSKLMTLWPTMGKWGITSLGKGFFEFAFSSLEDVQRVRSVSAWTLPQGILKLFPCTKDFTPATLKQTSAQVWIRIHGLSQEYWRPRILFAIASSIGTLVFIDSVLNKSAFERPFGHFVRVLLPEFCSYCTCIGYSITKCKRKEVNMNQGKEVEKKTNRDPLVKSTKKNPVEKKDDDIPTVEMECPENNAQLVGETSTKH